MLNRTLQVLLLLGAGWFVVGLVNEGRELARRMQCTCNMSQIAMAFHNFHDTHDCFPPPFPSKQMAQPSEPGKQQHSWRMAIVPYIEQSSIYDEFMSLNPDSMPWYSQDKKNLMRRGTNGVARYFRCPSRIGDFEKTNHSVGYQDEECPKFDYSYNPDRLPVSDYLAVVGEETAMNPTKAISFSDIKDGTSNTILVIESARSDRMWTEPRDLPIESLLASPQTTLRCHPRRPGFFMKPVYGANVVMCDGSVHWIPADIAPEQLRAMLTIDGGEEVDLDQVSRITAVQPDKWRIVGFAVWCIMLAVLITRVIFFKQKAPSSIDNNESSAAPSQGADEMQGGHAC